MHPAFALARRRLLDLCDEFGLFTAAESLVFDLLKDSADKAAEWTRNALRGTGIGMEGILKDLVIAVDGQVFAPSESWHAELLAQAASSTDDRRAIISDSVYGRLDELRRFRHVERNVYRQAFREVDVARNVEILKSVFPDFVAEVEDFIETFNPPASPGSTGPG